MIVVHNSDVLLDAAEPTLEVSGGVVRLSGFGSTVIVTLAETDLKLIAAAVWQKSDDRTLRAALNAPPPPKPQPLSLEALAARIVCAYRLWPSSQSSELYEGDRRRELGVRIIDKLLHRSGYKDDIDFYYNCTRPQRRAMGHTVMAVLHDPIIRSDTDYTGRFDEALAWINKQGGVNAISRHTIEAEQQKKAEEEKRERERGKHYRELKQKEREELARLRGLEARETGGKPVAVPDPPKDPITYVPRKA